MSLWWQCNLKQLLAPAEHVIDRCQHPLTSSEPIEEHPIKLRAMSKQQHDNIIEPDQPLKKVRAIMPAEKEQEILQAHCLNLDAMQCGLPSPTPEARNVKRYSQFIGMGSSMHLKDHIARRNLLGIDKT